MFFGGGGGGGVGFFSGFRVLASGFWGCNQDFNAGPTVRVAPQDLLGYRIYIPGPPQTLIWTGFNIRIELLGL